MPGTVPSTASVFNSGSLHSCHMRWVALSSPILQMRKAKAREPLGHLSQGCVLSMWYSVFDM